MLNYSTIQHDKICTFEGLKQRILIFQMNLEEFGTSKLFSVKNYQFDHAENNLKIIEYKSLMNKLKKALEPVGVTTDSQSRNMTTDYNYLSNHL